MYLTDIELKFKDCKTRFISCVLVWLKYVMGEWFFILYCVTLRIILNPHIGTIILYLVIYDSCLVFCYYSVLLMIINNLIYRPCLENQLCINYKFRVEKEDFVYCVHWQANLVTWEKYDLIMDTQNKKYLKHALWGIRNVNMIWKRHI